MVDAFENRERERVLESTLNHPLQGARTEGGVVALAGQLFRGRGRHVEGEAALREPVTQTAELDPHDDREVVLVQFAEANDVIDPVHELGSEELLGVPGEVARHYEQDVYKRQAWGRVFIEWLGSDGKAYIPKTSMPIEEFVDAAKGSSTLFSIAHPLVNYVDGASASAIEATMPRVMASLRERGFAGVEAYYGGTNEPTRSLMVKLTRDAGMIPTGGSDYHGTYKTDVKLGFGKSGDLRVPNEVLDELRALL